MAKKRNSKRTRKNCLSHSLSRAEERYQLKLGQHDIDYLRSVTKQGEAIPLNDPDNFLTWLPNGTKVRYVCVGGVGVVTFLPLLGNELDYVP